jgi:hypothetical protein
MGTEVVDEVVVTYDVVVVGRTEVVGTVVVAGTEVVDEVVVTYDVVVVGRTEVVEVVTVIGLKLAVTVIFTFIVTVHSPVPLHPPPDQPLNVNPGAAVAERGTTVPALKTARQVSPQFIPSPDTVPCAVPRFEIMRRYCGGDIAILTSFEYTLS